MAEKTTPKRHYIDASIVAGIIQLARQKNAPDIIAMIQPHTGLPYLLVINTPLRLKKDKQLIAFLNQTATKLRNQHGLQVNFNHGTEPQVIRRARKPEEMLKGLTAKSKNLLKKENKAVKIEVMAQIILANKSYVDWQAQDKVFFAEVLAEKIPFEAYGQFSLLMDFVNALRLGEVGKNTWLWQQAVRISGVSRLVADEAYKNIRFCPQEKCKCL